MSKAFSAMLARRFAPLNSSSVPSFPHPIPDMSEWGYFLPVFKEEKEDNPAEHLLKFHECMDLLDQQDEDVCMNMFMYSLYGDARQQYFSLPPSSISSLKDFHWAFNEHYKRYFSDELVFGNCCINMNYIIRLKMQIETDISLTICSSPSRIFKMMHFSINMN